MPGRVRSLCLFTWMRSAVLKKSTCDLRDGVVRTWRLINEAATAGVEAPELLAWTGGAPRLLVYTLRFLHAQPDLATPALVAAMEQALRVLSSIDAVALDVFIREGSPAFE